PFTERINTQFPSVFFFHSISIVFLFYYVNIIIAGSVNRECAWGCKKNSQGNMSYWKGYTLHLDVSDIGFPISVHAAGANVHDSQAAMLLEKMTMGKARHFYSVMDAAYDAREIKRCTA
ncbi:MAG: hypothetical protein LBP43_03775, partial [Treponema sp.]|nr:hypothetical protein [Treponema sp.]